MTDFHQPDTPPDAAPQKRRRKSANPEWILGVAIHGFANVCIDAPSIFLAFDRRRTGAMFQHLYEAKRGIDRGTLDTCLMVLGRPDAWVELKYPPGRVEESTRDDQWMMIRRLREAGRDAGWCDSVVGYCRLLADWGIPLTAGADIKARELDQWVAAKVEGKRARIEAEFQGLVAPRKAKARKAKVSRRRVAKVERVRSRFLF